MVGCTQHACVRDVTRPSASVNCNIPGRMMNLLVTMALFSLPPAELSLNPELACVYLADRRRCRRLRADKGSHRHILHTSFWRPPCTHSLSIFQSVREIHDLLPVPYACSTLFRCGYACGYACAMLAILRQRRPISQLKITTWFRSEEVPIG